MQQQKETLIHDSFSVIYRHGKMMHDKAMKKTGLSFRQMGYLRMIFENPGISQEKIAKCLKIDKGAVAKAIKDMAAGGYLRREENPNDRRAYRLYLTDNAQQLCRTGKLEAERVERCMTSGITEHDMEIFIKVLDKISMNIINMAEGVTDKDENHTEIL